MKISFFKNSANVGTFIVAVFMIFMFSATYVSANTGILKIVKNASIGPEDKPLNFYFSISSTDTQGQIRSTDLQVPVTISTLKISKGENEIPIDLGFRTSGTYTISENLGPHGGWNSNKISCSPAAGAVKLSKSGTDQKADRYAIIEGVKITADKTTTCTFDNVYTFPPTPTGTLIIKKIAIDYIDFNHKEKFQFQTYPDVGVLIKIYVPSNPQDKSPYTVTSPATPIKVGTYNIVEFPASNWIPGAVPPWKWKLEEDSFCFSKLTKTSLGKVDAEFYSIRRVKISDGDVVTCTFKNTIQTGDLVIKKISKNGTENFPFEVSGGPTAVPNLSIKTTRPPNSNDGIGSSKKISVLAGNYNIAEKLGKLLNWSADGISCITSGSNPNTVNKSAGITSVGITILKGETTTCTFSNDYTGPAGTLVIKKIALDQYRQPASGSFDFIISGVPRPVNIKTNGNTGINTETLNNLPAGDSYTITESFGKNIMGTTWDLKSISCTKSPNAWPRINLLRIENVKISDGVITTCTVTNQSGFLNAKKGFSAQSVSSNSTAPVISSAPSSIVAGSELDLPGFNFTANSKTRLIAPDGTFNLSDSDFLTIFEPRPEQPNYGVLKVQIPANAIPNTYSLVVVDGVQTSNYVAITVSQAKTPFKASDLQSVPKIGLIVPDTIDKGILEKNGSITLSFPSKNLTVDCNAYITPLSSLNVSSLKEKLIPTTFTYNGDRSVNGVSFEISTSDTSRTGIGTYRVREFCPDQTKSEDEYYVINPPQNLSSGQSTGSTLCDYNPAQGCVLIKGPNYDPTTNCGLVLSCPSPTPTPTPKICDYNPAQGCVLIKGPNYDPTTNCGLVLSCPSPTPTPTLNKFLNRFNVTSIQACQDAYNFGCTDTCFNGLVNHDPTQCLTPQCRSGMGSTCVSTSPTPTPNP